MVAASLTRHRPHQRVDDGGRAWYQRGHVPREPRRRRAGPPHAGPLLGGAARRRPDPHRRARRVRDPAHRARRAGARPVLPARCPSRWRPTPGCTSTSRAAPARRRWCSGPSSSGRRHLDIGQRDVPWVVLADPEGNPFCVMEERPEYAGLGPDRGAAARQRRPGPRRRVLGRAVRVAAGLVGDAGGAAPPVGARGAARALPASRRPRPRAPRTGCTSTSGSSGSDDADAVVARVVELGGRELDPGWGELPWRVVTDPSGNELCLLPRAVTPR